MACKTTCQAVPIPPFLFFFLTGSQSDRWQRSKTIPVVARVRREKKMTVQQSILSQCVATSSSLLLENGPRKMITLSIRLCATNDYKQRGCHRILPPLSIRIFLQSLHMGWYSTST